MQVYVTEPSVVFVASTLAVSTYTHSPISPLVLPQILHVLGAIQVASAQSWVCSVSPEPTGLLPLLFPFVGSFVLLLFVVGVAGFSLSTNGVSPQAHSARHSTNARIKGMIFFMFFPSFYKNKKCAYRSKRIKNANSDSRQTNQMKHLIAHTDGICIFVKFTV